MPKLPDLPATTPDNADPIHIALVGFMGSGKTTVGKLVAQATGLAFVDLDAVIEQATGASVAEFFREHGEVAFRAQERAALREILARPTPVLLATGGGTFIDPVTRAALQQAARCVFLRGDLESLWERLGEAGLAQRPLLAGPDAKATAARLWEKRAPIYAQCQLVVDTTGHGATEVAAEVVKILGLPRPRLADAAEAARRLQGASMPLLHIDAGAGTYAVELRVAGGFWIPQAIVRLCPGAQLAVISDDTVAPLHAASLVQGLRSLGAKVALHTFPAGEDSKALGTAGTLYDALLATGLGRGGAIVALGGGVVGDMAGFVASTYMRGIAYVQVPTTTLAAVDSSVGGKTAVNTPRGKNLVGTFYPPKGVLVAAAHLATQSPRAHAGGLVEAVKMAATHDAALFDDIVRGAPALLSQQAETLLEVIGRAVAIKAGVVSRDERERGERAALNVGHTVGHAIEVGSAYQLLHGEAVALGMMAEAEWAHSVGLCEGSVVTALGAALLALNMPTDWRRVKIDLEAMELDKKRTAADVTLPIVKSVGTFELCSVPVATLTEFVAQRK